MLNEKISGNSFDNKSVIGNNTFLDLLFHDAPDALLILDSRSYSIIDANAKAGELFETKNQSSLIGLSAFSLFENEPTEFSRNLLEMNIRKEGEHTQELAFRTLNRNIFWGRLKKQVFSSNDNSYILFRINKSFDSHKAEETLSALLKGTARVTGHKYFKELTRLICRTFDVNYSFIGKISDNRKFLNIIESSGDLNNVDPEKYTLEGSLFENVIRGSTTFYPKGLKKLFPGDLFLQKNGIEGFMGTPIFGHSGDVIGLIGFMHKEPVNEVPNSRYILSIFASRTAAEIQRIRSKEILKDQARKLTTSNDVKDKLLSVLSNDLINPLHTIMGFSELLRNKIDEYEKEKIIERFEIIDNSIRNIYFLLDNLTCWSNFYGKNVNITRGFISIDELIEENISLFKYIIEIKELTVTVEGNSAATLYSDKKMINSIIRNILSNAVKFTSKHGKIVIRVKESKSIITLSIEDNGIGIAPEELETFNRADKENPDLIYSGKKSIGLGLLLSRSHAILIGGSLQITGSQDNGTSVVITIPKG